MTTTGAAEKTGTSAAVTSLSSQYPAGLIGVPGDGIRLSWQAETLDDRADRLDRDRGREGQVAYEIQASTDGSFASPTSTTGVVRSSESIGVPAPGDPLTSREVRHFRVRIAVGARLETTDDPAQPGDRDWTEWSPVCTVEAGLLEPSDWSGVAVGIGSTVAGPAPLLRKEFDLPAEPVSARLYVTSLGVNEVRINGARIGDEHLNPGWTVYGKRVVVATYDITNALVAGANVVGALVGDGWYRGRIGLEDKDSIYGDELALIAQLEIRLPDGSITTIATDPSWRGSFGAVRSASIYDGTAIDATHDQPGWDAAGFEASGWTAVHEVALDKQVLVPRITGAVRTIDTLDMSLQDRGDRVLLDAGQNVAGWVRLTVEGRRGDTVAVRHAEVLEADGGLHTRSLRSAKATDTYVLGDDGASTLEPVFTFHGFRYADVVSPARVVSATAVAISSDVAPRGSFDSSDATLNRLLDNIAWSQRDNFVSLPTDCPQRDERLGWTGDAQAFAPAANTLFDAASFWRSWLTDVELDQDEAGAVAAVVPNIISEGFMQIDGKPASLMGRAGWGDAATVVPWSVYESFGSTDVLERQLESMRRWVGSLDARRGSERLLPEEFQFGDWLDPDAPGGAPWQAKVSAGFVANAFFAHSARILAATERLVGDAERAIASERLGDDVAEAAWATWGEHAVTTQTGCALALEFRICPDEDRGLVAEALAENVRAENGRIATGFLGTPLVLPALSKAGKLEEAYLMLLRRELPSWLYQVEMGATTVWERWDALLPDGTIHPGDMSDREGGHMLSFNHYAYGAVADWIFRTVAGLAPSADEPGYRRVIVAPRPVEGLEWVRSSIDTTLGRLAIEWRVDDEGLHIDLDVPFGAKATLDLPVGPDSTVRIDGEASAARLELGHGSHRADVTRPAIVAHSSR